MKLNRNIREFLERDLRGKMVLIGGPRQVGKTTLARSFIEGDDGYFSWDDIHDRALIRKHEVNPDLGIVVLDEIHKYSRWRTLLKGLYDKYHRKLKIIVTGSARLDHFRKGGDSLFGRFFYYRLHPLTYGELKSGGSTGDLLSDLLAYGGFPEPFLKKDPVFLKRWQRERISRVVNQDVQDLSLVKDISLIEVLVDLLPSRVGSLLSIKSLQEDLEVSPNTVSHWMRLLELVYYSYRIYPYGSKRIRALKKAAKLYLWDWSEIEEPGARLENLVASHLLKYCHFREDTQGVKMELRYLKDADGREVDFVVLEGSKPLFAVECKTGEKVISKSVRYFRERLPIERFYQVHLGTRKMMDGNIILLPFTEFCEAEEIP